jgi:hypothetical protein
MDNMTSLDDESRGTAMPMIRLTAPTGAAPG